MATKFTLCSFKTCPWVQRAAIVLQAKQVAYDIIHIDRDRRPDWFLAMSPHAKVPVLRIGESEALFESNAIAEYLDEILTPRLHPEDPLARARNRAWTDYVPTFASTLSAAAYSNTEAEFDAHVPGIRGPFGKLDETLAAHKHEGPYFNGARLSLVDAAYAPFLQRYTFIDRLRPLGIIDKLPRLAAWRDALLATPAVIASTVPEIEAEWQANLIRHNRWLGTLVRDSAIRALV